MKGSTQVENLSKTPAVQKTDENGSAPSVSYNIRARKPHPLKQTSSKKNDQTIKHSILIRYKANSKTIADNCKSRIVTGELSAIQISIMSTSKSYTKPGNHKNKQNNRKTVSIQNAEAMGHLVVISPPVTLCQNQKYFKYFYTINVAD